MTNHDLFERMFERAEQLKGGPLTDAEKEEIGEAFHSAAGDACNHLV